MPYLVLDILRDFPGVPGLFVASAYSGTLRYFNNLETTTFFLPFLLELKLHLY